MSVRTQDLSTGNWRAAIEAMLGNLGVDCDIEFSDEEIILKTKSEADANLIKDRLEKTLSSPQNYAASFPYTISRVHGMSVVEGSAATPLATSKDAGAKARGLQSGDEASSYSYAVKEPEDTLEAGITIFKNLFGPEAISDTALNVEALFNPTKGAHSKNKILFSKIEQGDAKEGLRKRMLEDLMLSFSGVSVSELRRLWNERLSLPAPKTAISEDETIVVSGLAKDCFRVIKDSNKQVITYFDYGLLYRYIFPPRLQLSKPRTGSGDQRFQITVNKGHLQDHLKTLNEGDKPLLDVVRYDEQNVVRPIFITEPERVEVLPHHYTIIIDRSLSMQGMLKQVNKQAIEFIDRLRTFDSEAVLRLVYFSNDADFFTELSIQEIYEIRQFLSMYAMGGTELFGTIRQEMKYLLDKGITKKYNTMVVLLTDGEDNNAATQRHQFSSELELMMKSFEIRGLKPPKMFTLGVEPGHDKETLNLLAKSTGRSAYIYMQQTSDFDEIYKHIPSIQYQQQLVEFLIKTSSASHHFSAELDRDGNAHTVGVMVPFEDSFDFEANGNQFHVAIDDASKIRPASFYDKMEQVGIKLNTILSSSESAQEKKKHVMNLLSSDFNQLLTELQLAINAGKASGAQSKGVESLRHKFQDSLNKLQNIIQNHDYILHDSLMRAATLDLGHRKHATVSKQAASPAAAAAKVTPRDHITVTDSDLAAQATQQDPSMDPAHYRATTRKLLWVEEPEALGTDASAKPTESFMPLPTSSARPRISPGPIGFMAGLARTAANAASRAYEGLNIFGYESAVKAPAECLDPHINTPRLQAPDAYRATADKIPHSTFTQPLTFNEILSGLVPVVTNYTEKFGPITWPSRMVNGTVNFVREHSPITLPGNKDHELNATETANLVRTQKSIAKMTTDFLHQQNSTLALSGAHASKFKFVAEELHELKQQVGEMLSSKTSTSNKMQDVDKRVKEVAATMKKLAKINHQLKQVNKEINTEARRLGRRGKELAGKGVAGSEVHFDLQTGQVHHKYLSHDDVQVKNNGSALLFSAIAMASRQDVKQSGMVPRQSLKAIEASKDRARI